ncbi:O-antigen ligase family protein [Empedobacter tilapiae]|uniref:O-antigen ligase family protein n=1 Tax=Empedobacter tilapiae TaxID=2491114 RepID=UPI0028D14C1B|nr:O-antigen ligase family protein [Empedobacter tilapiae]
MKNAPSIIKIIYFLLFPILLAYPNKLFEGLYINYIYIFFCLGLLFLNTNNKIIKKNKIVTFLGVLFLIVLFGNIFSSFFRYDIDLSDYIASTLRYFSYFTLSFILFQTTNNKDDLYFWIKSFLVGFTLSLVIILLDSYRFGFVESIFKTVTFESKQTLDIYFRAYGAYLSPISAGIFLMNTFIIISVTLQYVNLKKPAMLSLYFIIVLIIVCLIMTASRTALIGLLVYLFFVILKSKHRFKFLFFVLIGGLFIYYSGIIDTYLENILVRNEREAQRGSNVLEGSGRIDTFFNSIRLYFDWRTFFFGVGPSEYSKGDGTFSLAHNGFMSLILCYGLMGSLLFYKMLAFIYKRIKRNIFLGNLFFYYVLVNLVTFISSDGPVTHFWLLNFICFMYFIYFGNMFIIKKES